MEIQKIFVAGAGTMGSGIAQNALTSGYEVTLYDISAAQTAKAKAEIEKQLSRGVEKGRLSEAQKNDCAARLGITETLDAARDTHLVIEAASEKFEIKAEIFKKLSALCATETILASNTSSIPITKIASVCSNPSRFVGLHFFHPAPVMRLLEIIRGLETTDAVIDAAKNVGGRLGKVCIVSKDSAGFIVNRLLDPMLNEAVDLLDKGIATAEDIDKGCKYGLNHPMGPFELIDHSGADILLAVMETIYADTGDSKYRPAPLLRRMVEAGKLGKKTGIGFYDYTKEKK
jgi:3-hydroxybutyryl-CoA dehydrogenase